MSAIRKFDKSVETSTSRGFASLHDGEAVGAFTSSMGPRAVTAEEGDGCEMFTSSM